MKQENSPQQNRIDTVIFDIGNVLTDFKEKRFYLELGYPEEIAERLYRATMGSDCWVEYDRGLLSDEEILSLFQKNDPGLASEIARALSDTHGLVARRDSAIPWIRKVKAAGRKVLVLSNFSRKIKRECADALDFLPETDGGILSFQDRCVKPDPIIYALLLSRYQLDPAHAVFIDDTEQNLVAAREAGLQTILYRTQEQAEAELDEMLSLN
ncbi:MAG: HAD-IA family hydrolase [Eubacteriales bacterium]|nr:HAD-IA family hydrolase [Eubacteriales bacterium]